MYKSICYIILFLCSIFHSTRGHTQIDDTTAYYDSTSVDISPALSGEEMVPNFDSITTEDAGGVRIRKVNKEEVKKMHDDDDFWYYNTAPPAKKVSQKKKVQPSEPNAWLSSFLWTVVIGGFIAFLIWFLMTSNVQIFKSSPKRIFYQTEQETEDIFEVDYDKKIAAYVHAKEYTLAIRLMYLQLLTILSQKNMIDYQQQKTNHDYVMQLHGTPHYKAFFRITRHFEYTWYGHFPLSAAVFSEMKEEFDQFKNGLKA